MSTCYIGYMSIVVMSIVAITYVAIVYIAIDIVIVMLYSLCPAARSPGFLGLPHTLYRHCDSYTLYICDGPAFDVFI